tara:strand:+ start:1037 stop:1672 length:636 start_codon:yes stop_codon:yes gene_type:complete
MIRRNFLIASLVQVLLITGLAFFSSIRANSGTVVLFNIDPMQSGYPFNTVFRGWIFEPSLDSAMTKISNDLIKEDLAPFEYLEDDLAAVGLQNIFVTITEDDSVWSVSSASFSKPNEGLFLKSEWDMNPYSYEDYENNSDFFNVRYEVGNIFLSEESIERLTECLGERSWDTDTSSYFWEIEPLPMSVELSVLDDGNLIPLRLFCDGEEIK